MDTTKIIKGVVGSGRYTVTAPIVKEDYGLYLQIEGVELPSTYEVDFSNSEHNGTSVTMIGNSDGVLIPHQFIDTGKDVFAFLYHVGEDFGRTVYKFRIPNKLRPDRTDEEPTPEEQRVIDQAISALNTAVAKTAQDVISADQSARSASGDADRAERARTAAETAQGKAEEAQESAERAKNDAETSERNASESERNAKGYSETASEKADSIHSMTASAQTLPAGSSASASYDAQTGVMSFGIPKGKDGTDGDDGYSPTANVSKTGKVATITITDKNGTTSAQVEDGTDGIDGISPSVSVTDITGGHRVVITDKDGTKSFDVEDGATGATPNLTIGTVTTLEPDASATATITGTAENPVLNLGLPKGQTGEVTEEEFTQLKEDLNAETDYLKSKNYDTRLATLNTMGVGHFVSGSMPSTNGNYTYYRHTPLIPLRDLTITIDAPIDSGLYMIVGLFDANGEFVRVTRNNVSMVSATYSATKNWMTAYGQYDVPYVRLEFYRYPYTDITSDITVIFADDSENVSVKVNRINNATLDDMSISFDTNDFVTGYLNVSGVLVENNEYKTSPFIAVNDQMVVTIGELMTTVWRTVFCYDSERTLIESIEYNGKTTTTLTNYDVFLPHGTSYIRFVIGANRLSVASVTYKMVNIPYHHLAPSLLEHWNDQTFGKMNGLFKQATGRALITIIDDDTASSAYVTMFHDACEAQGIKGSYAVITSRWDLDNTLKDTLLEFESEGYGMCAHCYVQDSKWNNPVTNMSECEADMIKCIRDMQSAGFINFRHWLTPAGHVESAVQDLAKRLGMQCAVSSGWHEIETTQAKYGRYALRRCSLEAADGTGALTVNDFKALIDDAVACNGWLLITTHMGNGNWDATAIANRFDAVVDYAQSKYMKFTTLQEAWAIRRPIYEFYEQF